MRNAAADPLHELSVRPACISTSFSAHEYATVVLGSVLSGMVAQPPSKTAAGGERVIRLEIPFVVS